MREAEAQCMSQPGDSSDAARTAGSGEPEAAPDVDVTLIDEMLRMTPEQRLRQNDRMAALALKLMRRFGRPAVAPESE